MNYKKLSEVKRHILWMAYHRGCVSDSTYPKQKESLRENGWLQAYCPDGLNIISGMYMLTPAGREAYEAARIQV